MGTARTLDEIAAAVVDAAYRLHKGLEPGLLESVYERVLAGDLQRWCANGEAGMQRIIIGLDREAMKRRSGRVSA